jgi:putative hemolysin
MTTILLEVGLILVLTVFNGVLAMSEIAIVSARHARLQRRANEGDRGAEVALKLAADPNRFLSTVQVGITLVGIFAGAFGGATLAQELAVGLEKLPVLAGYWQAVSLAIVVAGMAYLSLVIGELAPKRIALSNAEGVAAAVARPMNMLARLMSPAVRLLSLSTEAVVQLLGVPFSSQTAVSEEEIKILLEQGTRSGVIEEIERDIVRKVFLLDDLPIGSLMTPRTKIDTIRLEDPPETNWRKIAERGHSNYPVYRGQPGSLEGIVSVKTLWAQTASGHQPDLEAALHPALFLPEGMPALTALERFKEAGTRLAVIINELGEMEGSITLTDILEAIVGDIPLQGTLPEPRVDQLADGSWLVDGLMPIESLRDLFKPDQLPDEGANYSTVGGMVMKHIGRVPKEADAFEWGGFRFEVVDMDGYRVDKVRLIPADNRADR